MDRASDNESDTSFPEVLSREQMTKLDSDDFLNRRRDTEGNMIDQRFHEINRQIGKLTNIVLVLTQQNSSREGNGLNLATTSANSRSDMVEESRTHSHQAHERLLQMRLPEAM